MPACCRDNAEIILQGKIYHEARCRICGVEWIQIYDPDKLKMLADRKKNEEGDLFHEPLRGEQKEEKKVLRRHPSIHGVYI